MLYLLDTDTSSYLIKGKSPVIERKIALIPPTQIAISAVTQAELMYGLKRIPPQHRLHLAVREFLKIVRVLPWGPESSDAYAEIRNQLVTTGQPIGEMDMMIAAQALALSATLVTNNIRHFERIKAPMILENWTEAP